MSKMSVSDDCIDMVTPFREYLSAKYKRSFAYHTVRNRLPVILTQVIDHLSREKEIIARNHGEESKEEIKEVIGYLSKMKNEMQTNKALVPFKSGGADISLWNDFLRKKESEMGQPLFWFSSIWLHVECYMYRRIREAFEITPSLHSYDPFRHLKEDAFTGSLPAITTVANNLLKVIQQGNIDVQKVLQQFLKLSLWGNRCDLSISGGKDASQQGNPLDLVEELNHLILVNDIDSAWTVLSKPSKSSRIVDIVFDNSGYEVFTDLCLADFLLRFDLVDKIRFHAKSNPWFVSDVMESDFHWTLQAMTNEKELCLPTLAKQWQSYVDSGKWLLYSQDFWTLPYSYDEMHKIDPELFKDLSESTLIIFKGDLNYRKLMGDVNWPHTEKFEVALRGFKPAPLISLRTIKADVVTGMREGLAEETAIQDPDWMITGKYAVISSAS